MREWAKQLLVHLCYVLCEKTKGRDESCCRETYCRCYNKTWGKRASRGAPHSVRWSCWEKAEAAKKGKEVIHHFLNFLERHILERLLFLHFKHLCWKQKLWLAFSFLLVEQPHVQLHIPMSTWLFSLQLRISSDADFVDEGNLRRLNYFLNHNKPENMGYLQNLAELLRPTLMTKIRA